MSQVIKIQFQCASSGKRPSDEALNPEEIVTKNISDVPSVGDYISFNDGIVYKVKTRFFDYDYKPEGSWSIFANVVVEQESEDRYNRLIKH